MGSKFAGALALAVAAALLAGCESSGGSPVCPDVARLKDTERVTMFRGREGRDLTDIVYDAEVVRVGLTCTLTDEAFKLDVTADVVAKRGPTATIEDVQLPVFAVVARGEQVVVRTGDTADISFDSDGNGSAQVEMEFEAPREKGEGPHAVEVLSGFVLSRDQLAYNRFRHGGPPPVAPDAQPLATPEAPPPADPAAAQ